MQSTRPLIALFLTAFLVGNGGICLAADEEEPTLKPVQELVGAFKVNPDPRFQFLTIAVQLDQKLEGAGEDVDRIAGELIQVKGALVSDAETLKLLNAIVEQKNTTLAARLLLQTARARYNVRARSIAQKDERARVVVGQLVVEDRKADPTLVLAQMPILEEGFFAGEVGDLKRPLCFRFHGYQDLDVSLDSKEGEVVHLGRVIFRPLPIDQRASLRGRIALDEGSDGKAVTLTLSVSMGPINTPGGGFSGRRRWPEGLSVPVSSGGDFAVDDLNPSEYSVFVSAKGHADLHKKAKLAVGQPLHVGTYRLFSSDLGFYLGTTAPKTEPLAWEKDYPAALKRAKTEQKPLFVMMTATWCGPCKLLEEKTLNDSWVRYFLSSFVVVKAYEDKEVERTYGFNGYPTLVFADSSGKLAHKCVGYMPVTAFSTECAKAFKAMGAKQPPELDKLIEKKVLALE